MTTSRYLIITADDFGYSSERNDGILACYHDNSISNVSLMVNGYSAEEAVKKAKATGLPMGLHLNLTEGSPVGDGPYKSIVGTDGFMLGKFGIRIAMAAGKIDMAEIFHRKQVLTFHANCLHWKIKENVINLSSAGLAQRVQKEIKAQLKKFEKLTGELPISVDGHQHAHIIPGICEIFASILKDHGIIWTRLPLEGIPAEINNGPKVDFMKEVHLQAQQAKGVFTRHGLKFPSFTGMYTMGNYMSLDNLQLGIQQAFENQSENKCSSDSSSCNEPVSRSDSSWNTSDNIAELMVHPGYRTGHLGGCGDGPDDFAQSSEREHEIKILMDPTMKVFYADRNIKLASFMELLHQTLRL